MHALDHEVCPVCSGAKMMNVILIFNLCLVYFFPITTGRKLSYEIKGWLLHHTVEARFLSQRDDSSASKEVHERNLAHGNTSRSTSVTFYAQKLRRLTHRSENPNFPRQVPKIKPGDLWKRRVKRKEECFSSEFECAIGRCIPYQWRCDGVEDCADESDEHGCSTPQATKSTETTTEPHSTGARGSGLSDATLWSIIGGCLAFFVILLYFVPLFLVRWRATRRPRSMRVPVDAHRKADGYRTGSLRTASPAYAHARQYFPVAPVRRQENQSRSLNYADLSFHTLSKSREGKQRSPYVETDCKEMSPEKRPPATDGGQGEGGGFELWC